MAQERGFALSFGMVLAMAVIILAITTWADYLPNPRAQFDGANLGAASDLPGSKSVILRRQIERARAKNRSGSVNQITTPARHQNYIGMCL
jgi:hypothetical protein